MSQSANEPKNNNSNTIPDSEILRILKSESGFSAELKALEQFLLHGTATDAGVYYLDPNSGKAREIDLVGLTQVLVKSERTSYACIKLIFVCDVKSSVAPTIVFSSLPSQPDKTAKFFSKVFWADESFGVASQYTSDFGSIQDNARVGRAVVQVSTHSNKQDKNRVTNEPYKEAIYSSLKASKYFIDRQSDELMVGFLFDDKPICKVLSLPIVIIDGPL